MPSSAHDEFGVSIKAFTKLQFQIKRARKTVGLFQVEKAFVSDSNAEQSMYLHEENALEIIFR